MSKGSPTSSLSYRKGVRYTYRYSTTITTTLHGSSAGRNGLALDCVVDIDVVSKCHLMMQVSFIKIVCAILQKASKVVVSAVTCLSNRLGIHR